MANKMDWKDCTKQGIISKIEPDEERAKQMLMMTKIRYKFWDRSIVDEFIALKVEAYYDIIKELMFAHLYKKGYNCTNHLCLIAFLRKHFDNFDYEI